MHHRHRMATAHQAVRVFVDHLEPADRKVSGSGQDEGDSHSTRPSSRIPCWCTGMTISRSTRICERVNTTAEARSPKRGTVRKDARTENAPAYRMAFMSC